MEERQRLLLKEREELLRSLGVGELQSQTARVADAAKESLRRGRDKRRRDAAEAAVPTGPLRRSSRCVSLGWG